MKKIIIIILIMLILIGGGIFVALHFFGNVSDEIEVDETKQIIETVEQDIITETKEKPKKEYDVEKIDTVIEKELTPIEQYEKDYMAKVNKHFKGKNPEAIRTALSTVIQEVFVNNSWHLDTNEQACKENHEIYFPNYLSEKFIDTYNKKGVLKTLGYNGQFVTADFIPTTDKLYIEVIHTDKDLRDKIYFTFDLKDNKIYNLQEETTLDLLDPSYEVKINELNYTDAILNIIFEDEILDTLDIPKFKVEGEDNLTLELKGNNYYTDNVFKYLGQWEDEKGFYSNWGEKFVNLSVGVEKDKKDYQDNFTVMFEEKNGVIKDIRFLVKKKKLLGNSDNREEREQKEQQHIEANINRAHNLYIKELEEEKEFLDKLDKVLKDTKVEEKEEITKEEKVKNSEKKKPKSKKKTETTD